MSLEDIIEKIKRLDAGGNGTNIVCFIVAFDLLDIRRFDGILRNILQEGITVTVDHLFEMRKKEK